jgi:hypothetical protein
VTDQLAYASERDGRTLPSQVSGREPLQTARQVGGLTSHTETGLEPTMHAEMINYLASCNDHAGLRRDTFHLLLADAHVTSARDKAHLIRNSATSRPSQHRSRCRSRDVCPWRRSSASPPRWRRGVPTHRPSRHVVSARRLGTTRDELACSGLARMAGSFDDRSGRCGWREGDRPAARPRHTHPFCGAGAQYPLHSAPKLGPEAQRSPVPMRHRANGERKHPLERRPSVAGRA